MNIRLIAASLVVLLLAGPAFAQGNGQGDRDRRPRVEQGSGGRQPNAGRSGADRRDRIDRAQERIRERQGRRGGRDAGDAPRGGGGDIYRRSNNYRRW